MSSPLLTFLQQELRLSERSLNHLIATAPERYKVYRIPKRTDGYREIAQPASELKAAQRALVNQFLKAMPVHPSATAYVSGSSIRLNAQLHARNGPILKYDFANFFPSLTEHAWIAYCEETGLFDRADSVRSGRILFRRPKGGRILRLSIGAPSSPIVSNLLMHNFDREVYERVSPHKITYTRYADDLTFSALRTGNLTVVDKIIKSVLNQMTSPKLKINDSKTVLVTPRYRRQVTGLVITNDKRVSLGRDKKRRLRASIHHYKNNKLDVEEIVKLSGMMAFAKDVEPEFYTRMERVYGKKTLDALKATVTDYKRPVDY